MRPTRPLVIVGAGGFAREAAEAVRAVNSVDPTWELLGLLDDDPRLAGARIGGLAVLGSVATMAEYPDAAVVVCTGSPTNFSSRRGLVARMGLPPARFATIVHPAAWLASSTTVGEGTVILAGVVTTTTVTIGRHVAVMPQTVFTHDDIVADYATFGAGVRLAGAVRIGEGAYIGSGALVREQRSVGPGALVGMGAVVTVDIPGGEAWAGVPARYLRAVSDGRDQPEGPAAAQPR